MLLAYNKTVTAVPLAVVGTVLPPSATSGTRGPAVNVTAEMRGLTQGQYETITAQVIAGTVDLAWIGDPEYATVGLLAGSKVDDAVYSNSLVHDDTGGYPPYDLIRVPISPHEGALYVITLNYAVYDREFEAWARVRRGMVLSFNNGVWGAVVWFDPDLTEGSVSYDVPAIMEDNVLRVYVDGSAPYHPLSWWISVSIEEHREPVPPPRPLRIVTSWLSDGEVWAAYPDEQFSATGGVPPYRWSLETGSVLPAGLTFSEAGLLSGTPEEACDREIVFKATDAIDQFVTQPINLLVVAVPLEILTASLPPGVLGEPYSQQFSGQGGKPPRVWSLNPGSSLPNGLIFDSSGLLSGTPTEMFDADVTFRLTDDLGAYVTRTLHLHVVVLSLDVFEESDLEIDILDYETFYRDYDSLAVGTVAKVRLETDWTHSYGSDVRIRLYHGGEYWQIPYDFGGGDHHTDDLDESIFVGASVTGLWELEVYDRYGGDEGVFHHWKLTIYYG